MRILHVVKTTNGGQWAAWQAAELVRAGVEVHAALPDDRGRHYPDWLASGAILHRAQLSLPTRAPWELPALFRATRRLVDKINPDIIHSHFVSTTLTLRHALGPNHPVKRVFQIPGPLHLEHAFYRKLELSSAGESDYWIPSSRYIGHLLRGSGIPDTRQFLSYYGCQLHEHSTARTYEAHKLFGIQRDQRIIGNISWFYKPKYYLGQTVGLKCHEDIIDALAMVVRKRRDLVGVLVGSGFNNATAYEDRLRTRARKAAGDRIRMPGGLASSIVRRIWPDFDCAIHVPLSENCGGAVEPLCAGVPTIASNVGGLPELVLDGLTGRLVPPRSPAALADAILAVFDDLQNFRLMAERGRCLVKYMFDIHRTSQEIHSIYGYLLGMSASVPKQFDCHAELGAIVGSDLRIA